MNIGGCRRQITIESVSVLGSTTSGEPVYSWAAYASNVWAEVNPTRGVESAIRTRIISTGRVLFRVRYVAATTPEMRVLYGGEYYNIVSVENVRGLNRWLLLECELIK